MVDKITAYDVCTKAQSAGATLTGVSKNKGVVKRMLNRQRIILALLAEAGGAAHRTSVTKWAFLLREESPSHGGYAFYQFVPYEFGPFSFCLYQEFSALGQRGYVIEGKHEWTLTRTGARAARQAPADVLVDVGELVRTHANKSIKSLINYVYDKFPWYTINSTIRKLEAWPVAPVAVYTAGYEGLLVDGFLDSLMRAGIRRVIDVRNNPVSRRYGFHKSTLSRLCGKVSIDYVHFPQLGIVSKDRQNLDKPGARQKLFDSYAASTLKNQTSSVEDVAGLVSEGPSALMCIEACPHDCHRSRLAESVAAVCELPIRHLDLGRA